MRLNNPIVLAVIKALAIVALGLTIVPSFLYLSNIITLDPVKFWMAIGMVLWFLNGTLWLGQDKNVEK